MIQSFWIDGPLPGLNEIIDAAKIRRGKWNAYNDMKQEWGAVCVAAIRKARLRPVEGPIVLAFHWVEQAKRRDLGNIRVGEKFVVDALVQEKILQNDGWKQVRGLRDTFGVDKDNPGARIYLIPHTEPTWQSGM